MDNLAGVIIMAICTFGCALLFYGISIWAENSPKPVHFWSGSKVDPSKVLDIPSYNHACAVMWKRYSVPYWSCGILACLDLLHPGCMMISVIMLLAACLVHSGWSRNIRKSNKNISLNNLHSFKNLLKLCNFFIVLSSIYQKTNR